MGKKTKGMTCVTASAGDANMFGGKRGMAQSQRDRAERVAEGGREGKGRDGKGASRREPIERLLEALVVVASLLRALRRRLVGARTLLLLLLMLLLLLLCRRCIPRL